MERCIGEKFKYSDNINLIAVEQDESKNVIFLETVDIDFNDSYKYSVFEDFFPFIKCEHGYNLMKS